MAKGKNKGEFYKHANILEVLDDKLAGKNGSVTIGIELFLKDYHSFSLIQTGSVDEEGNKVEINELENIIKGWSEAMQKVGSGVVWHKQDIFYPCSETPKIEGVDYMSKALRRYYFGHTFLNHRCYLFVTRLKTGISEYVSGKELTDFMDRLQTFLNNVDESCVRGYKIMQKEDHLDYLYSMATLDFSNKPKSKKILLDMDFKHKMIGDYFLDTYYISENEQAQKVDSYSVNPERTRYDQNVVCINSYSYPLAFSINALHIMNNIIMVPPESSINHDIIEAKKAASFIRKEDVVAQNEEFQEGMDHGLSTGVRHHFSVHVLSDTEEHRARNRKKIEVALTDVFGAAGKATYNLDKLWLNTLGGGASALSKNDTYYTYLAWANAYNNWEGIGTQMRKGIVLQDVNKVPFVVDLFDEPKQTGLINNYNSITIGPTGSGKSVWTNYYSTGQYLGGDKVVIIDLGRSYQKLCDMLGGRFISYESTDDLSLNPFCITEPFGKNQKEEEQNFKEFLIDLLFTCWDKKPDEQTAEQRASFEDLLNSFYDVHKAEGDLAQVNFDSFYQFLEERKDTVDENFLKIRDFLHVTRKYTRAGAYGTLLNGDNGLDITRDNFVVFEMEKIMQTKSVKSIVIAVLLNFITRTLMSAKFKRSGQMLRLHIDEGWKFMEEPEVAGFIKYAFKTFRKLGGGVNVIVQSISDFIQEGGKAGNNLGNTIVDSADTIFHLRQMKTELTNKYGPQISLSPKEINMVNSMQPHEVFIKQGNLSKLYKVVLPDEWLALFNTNKDWQSFWIDILEKNQKFIQPAVDQMADKIAEIRNQTRA